jgi:hypothetical protein
MMPDIGRTVKRISCGFIYKGTLSHRRVRGAGGPPVDGRMESTERRQGFSGSELGSGSIWIRMECSSVKWKRVSVAVKCKRVSVTVTVKGKRVSVTVKRVSVGSAPRTPLTGTLNRLPLAGHP